MSFWIKLGLGAVAAYALIALAGYLAQRKLMYFPDRVTSLGELWRILAPKGRLAIAVWAPLARARGYQVLVDVAARMCGPQEANVLAAPFVLGDRAELATLFDDSGISAATIALHEGSIRFTSVEEFIRVEVKGSPLAETVSDDAMESLAAESESALAEFVLPSGEIVMPMDAYVVTATKG